MSLYTIPNAPGSPASRLTTVGWDRLSGTFWAQAYDDAAPGSANPVLVFSYGNQRGEVPTVEALQQVLSRHGITLSDGVRNSLARDQERGR